MNKKEIAINTAKAKNSLYTIVFAIVTLLYVIMYNRNLVSPTLGLGLIVFFAIVTLYFVYRTFAPKATLVINQEGIKENVVRGKGLIKWDKISEIYICVIPKKKYDTNFLGIKYKKDESDKRKVKFKGKIDKKVGDAIIVIDDLEIEPYDIYNKIQKYYSKFIRK